MNIGRVILPLLVIVTLIGDAETFSFERKKGGLGSIIGNRRPMPKPVPRPVQAPNPISRPAPRPVPRPNQNHMAPNQYPMAPPPYRDSYSYNVDQGNPGFMDRFTGFLGRNKGKVAGAVGGAAVVGTLGYVASQNMDKIRDFKNNLFNNTVSGATETMSSIWGAVLPVLVGTVVVGGVAGLVFVIVKIGCACGVFSSVMGLFRTKGKAGWKRAKFDSTSEIGLSLARLQYSVSENSGSIGGSPHPQSEFPGNKLFQHYANKTISERASSARLLICILQSSFFRTTVPSRGPINSCLYFARR